MLKTNAGDVVGSSGLRFLRRRDLRAKVGYSAAHIDRLEKAGLFPKRVVLGPGAVAWLESEIDDWIRSRLSERDEGARTT